MAFNSQKNQGHRPMADINVTPMVDVMLVLLVIFIMAAPLLTHSVKVDLPNEKAQSAQQDSAPWCCRLMPKVNTSLTTTRSKMRIYRVLLLHWLLKMRKLKCTSAPIKRCLMPKWRMH